MPQTTKDTRIDFSTRAADTSRQGFVFLRGLEDLVSDYADIFAVELTNDDYKGTPLEGMDINDIGAAVKAALAISDLLSADNAAARLAFKRLAQFSK